jgi:cryptochrome
MYWIRPSLIVVLMSTMKKPMVAMHWFRKGLRLHDNPGLIFSSQKEDVSKLYPVYVMDGDSYQLKHCTALRANFLMECLQDMDDNLRKRGSRLYVEKGDPVEILPKLWDKWGVTHMTFEQDETGEPYAKDRDETVLKQAEKCGIEVKIFASETLHPLEKYVDKSSSAAVPNTMGSFQKLLSQMGKVPLPRDAPSEFPPSDDQGSKTMQPPKKPTDFPGPRTISKSDVTPLWGPKDCQNLTPIVRGGESHALKQLQKKVTDRPTYVATFEKPKTSCVATNEMSTTVLSPYMTLGCLSPRKMWYAIEESSQRSNATKSKPPMSLHGQVLWRDFNNLMAHSANRNQPGSWGKIEGNQYCRPVPWSDDPELLQAWKEGRTGYPWIDACMKQLEQEGWIHHLGRHAVACFLTRGDLWQSWEKGAHHFESQLLDADYALNGFNWLWLSCSGFFYQYFRCYSPIVFQKKNDPNGEYIRKYLPELRELPAKYIYEPWKAPIAIQNQAGVRIGKDYPKPIVDHAYVSKENMSKMALAYDAYKEANGKGSKSDTKKRAPVKGTSKKAPAKKKQKKLTDY